MQYELFETEHSIKKGDTIVCKFCNVEKNISSFSFASGGNYRHRTCKTCTNDQQKIRDKLRSENKLPDQNYCCPICNQNQQQLEPLNNPNQIVWALDHDWKTGLFRGWICHKCNRALGMFGDNLDTLKRAFDYLRRHNDSIRY